VSEKQMKLTEKLKAYLVWGCVMMFFASLIQIVIYVGFAILKPHDAILIGMSILDWVYFAIFTHIWARDDPRGNKE